MVDSFLAYPVFLPMPRPPLFGCLSRRSRISLTKRLANIPGAWVASLIVAMSPIYASISSFVRVESLCVCFILGGLLCLLHALDETPESAKRQWFGILAGFLCGLAAATELHSIIASLPVIICLITFSTEQREGNIKMEGKGERGARNGRTGDVGSVAVFQVRAVLRRSSTRTR